eukprot:TRINITY_DN36324_c0_g1_i2.p1 TRINITY_DN36324_c0_g1~~TRINITY_DN36324_c0_g1_i2.p1  ORF type:complete len:127 (-),score=9.87 TRINITY_DN36324_c0_g1_i2:112-492(-)
MISDALQQPIGSISLSNDGQCLLVSTLDNKIRLIERESGSELAVYKGHTNQRVKLQSSLDPSDAFVVSGSEDSHLYFWELVEGTPLPGPRGDHAGAVLCVSYFEDTLVSASADSTLKVWKPSVGPR